MSSIQELREKRTAKAREYRNLLDRHPESHPGGSRPTSLTRWKARFPPLMMPLPAMKRRWPWKPTV